MNSVKVCTYTTLFGYCAIIMPYVVTNINFCYQTQTFKTKKQVIKEARDFCKWKKVKIKKINYYYK